jgi:TonB family protein
VAAKDAEMWVPAGSFERLSDKEAREKRAASISKFTPQPGRAVEATPVFLAPDYGAARWGDLADGDDVEVLLADYEFYGIRLAGQPLAFVPARSIRLLPSGTLLPPPAERRRGPAPPPVAVAPRPGTSDAQDAAAPPPPGGEPYEELPAGAEAPDVIARVEPRYPDLARRMGLSGEVLLKVTVERSGSVGAVKVMSGAPGGMTDAAIDAVKRWVYRPAKLGGRPVAVNKLVRIRFSLR